jgi:phospholipid/cholesterol/gamma-HCH transport system substrate-binding protein
MALRDRSLEFKVGLLLVGALVILGGFVVVLGNFSLGPGFRLYVDYDFSGNIQPGAPVKVSGIKVGKVEAVDFWGGKVDPETNRSVQVRVTVWVQARVKDSIREDAEFFVNTAGVLGEQYLEIAPGTHAKPLLASAYVVGVDPPRTDLIVARLYEFLDSVTSLLKEDKDLIRNLLKDGAAAVHELNTLLADNHQELAGLIVNASKLADQASGLIGDVRTGLGDPKVIGRTVASAERTLAGADRALTEITPRANKLLDEGVRVTGLVTDARVERAMAAADGAVKTLDKAGALIANVDGAVTDVRAGKGTAGKLLTREELYADLKEMVRDLRRNPWKFFWKE